MHEMGIIIYNKYMHNRMEEAFHMQPRKTFFDPSERNTIKLTDLVDFSSENRDDTAVINESLLKLSQMGGGTLYLAGGVFYSRTINLQSNVTIYVDKSAVLKACPGEYEYEDLIDPATGELYPWALKQDAGHTWYKNSFFHGESVENIKIIGNGKIDGNDVITKYDSLAQDQAFGPMKNQSFKPRPAAEVAAANRSLPSPDSRGRTCNKMFALRRCKNVEIGGICPSKDLWYDGDFEGRRGRVGYLNNDGSFDFDSVGNMLHITDTGHFAILASGLDELHIHDLYMDNAPNMRDSFNLMSCRDVVVCNIYIEGCSDDVIKFASDYSMEGNTRPGGNAIVRNIVGDTECSLLLVGGETADDLENICFDNAICLAANKSAVLIGTSGNANIRNVHVNCGGSVGKCSCGTDHGALSIGYEPAKAHPFRTHLTHMRMPFNISAACYGPGAPNGKVENVYISKITCDHVYAGSRAKACIVDHFPDYEAQAESTSMIQGSLASDAPELLEKPGRARIRNVVFEDVDILVKGGHPESERLNVIDPSVGAVGLRQADKPKGGSNLPAYGFYIRHADGVHFKNCTIATEKLDGRQAFQADDATDVTFENGNILNPAPRKGSEKD